MDREPKAEQQEIQQRVDSIRRLEIGNMPKAELVLVLLGLKRSTSVTLFEWNSPKKEFEQGLNDAGLSFEAQEDKDGKGNFEYFIALTKETARQLSQTDPSKDHVLYGQLMSFPETAVEAFENDKLLPIEEQPKDSENIFDFRLSQDHWQDELKKLEEWSQAIAKYAPEIYNELKGNDQE